ncbi:hypothetical protein IMK15_06245 [Sneathia sp. DSM 16631]|nr:hypothetical protein [Sneathia sp. DSM 16631]MBE3031542.1 hypothetical protein [Sneathia sp. DSM 16631]
MKKTLLLTSLVASMVAMAGTTGSVKSYAESEAKFETKKSVSDDQKKVETNTTKSYKVGKIGVETEVKVKGSGLSFGGTFEAKDLELGKVTPANYLNHSSVWAKYELPELKGFKTYVKATVSPKFDTTPEYEKVPEVNTLKTEINKMLGSENDKAKVNEKLVKVAKEKGLSETEIAKIKATDEKDNQVLALANAEIAAANAKNAEVKREDAGSAELEGQVSYKYGEFTFGFNSKTNFPLSNKTYNYAENALVPKFDVAKDYGKLVKSTHKLFVESEEGKDVFVKGLKDVKANVEVKHDYRKIEKDHKASEAVEYVSGEVSAKYDTVKDLELEGKVAFKKNISGEKIGDYEVLGTKLFKESPARYIHSYELKGTYKGVKHLTLSAKPFVAHVNIFKEVTNDNKVKRNDYVVYGVELNAEYKMLNDKLTLTGKSLLAGLHDRAFDGTLAQGSQLTKTNAGVFVFDANAKYDYSVTDKFTVSPEANANLELFVVKPVDKLVTKPTLTLTPKVSAKYVPVEGLTIEGEVSVPVKFGVVTKSFEKTAADADTYDSTKAVNGFGYDSTSIKTSLNLKYEWK